MPDPNKRASLVGLPVTQYLQRLASADPAPGGGSAAALAGAMAAALVAMVAHGTKNKERYAPVREEMKALASQADAQQARLSRLIDADADAFGAVILARRLPHDTPDEQAVRQAAIQEAMRGAVATPLETAAACTDILELAVTAAILGNHNATADALTAAWLASAALRTATRNVQANLPGLTDADYVRAVEERLTHLAAEARETLARIEAEVNTGA